MITKITMKNVASYKTEATLETDKEINLIYGLNGSGKTILSNYLYDLTGDGFSDCDIDGFEPEQQKIMVYNQNFIEENFYESDIQKGIFTLAKKNKAAEEAIKVAEDDKKRFQEECERLNSDKKNKQSSIEENKKVVQDKTWEIKENYSGGDRVFDRAGFLDGLKRSKEDLFNYLTKIPLPGACRAIEEIKKELQELGKDATERGKLNLIETNLPVIEENSLFQEAIIGNQDNTISNLIEKLKNSDWVKEGISYFPKEDDKTCPFCQEPTLTPDLKEKIKSYFDETYQNKVDELRQLERQYHSEKGEIPDNFIRDFFEEKDKETIKRLSSELQQLLNQNVNKIEGKLKQPSQTVTLDKTEDKINEINQFIRERNSEIEEFNRRIRDRENTIKSLGGELWKILRKQYDQTIEAYESQNRRLGEEIKSIQSSINDKNKKIQEQDQIISEQQKKTSDIRDAIDNINNNLIDFGIQDFSIIKSEDEEGRYRIKRDTEEPGNPIFKTLSEGEKTIISFLYFVEQCTGKENPNDTKEKIIVIDDPISSLSHMYIFNVAQLIKHKFINELIKPPPKVFLQCFVLTHSLYFFHELVERGRDKNYKKFFRISKGQESRIKDMDHSEVQNEYEAYWSLVKDPTQGNTVLVANAMRNIIEYFFGFIEKKDSIKDIFNKGEFQGNNFQSFKRYMDRESHSDRMNINDYNEFDLDIFKEAFRCVFASTEYEKHYEKMMGSSN